MSAVLQDEAARIEPMREADLTEVVAIEQSAYAHPWTRGNFADSLRAGYACRALRLDARLIGYFVLMIVGDEAHLLNLTVRAACQRRGHGSVLLGEAMRIARRQAARRLLLEVRPSNLAAQALYEKFGFSRLAIRRGYYPADGGREDAFVLSLAL